MPAPRVTKRQLTKPEAAAQWLAAKKKLAKAKTDLEEAEAVLKPYLARLKSRVYKGVRLVSFERTVLDQEKVRGYLGKQLPKFQKQAQVEYLAPTGDGAE